MEIIIGIVIFLVVGYIILSTLEKAYRTRCPNCRQFFAGKHVGRQIINSQRKFKTVSRRDVHRDARGNMIGETERREQAAFTQTSYLDHFECPTCHIRWSHAGQEEKEG